jgi:outer membrane receptor protein involved in Fe transport
LTLPTGALQLAIGGGWRDESYRLDSKTSASVTVGSRNVGYLFAEALVPLVAPSEERAGLHALDLSLSGRFEDYSDFGSTSTPKVGLRYVPAKGVTLRSTWGESFKAPSFQQLVSGRTAVVNRAAVYGYTGGGTAILAQGGNPDLVPERSTSWTAGIDWAPPALSSLTIGLTYFNIDYTDRVVSPISPVSAALSNPAYAPFVTLNPSAALQQDVIDAADIYLNLSGAPYDPDSVVAVIRNAYANATSQQVQGVDFSYRQDFALPSGQLSAFANATWTEMKQQTLSTLPEVERSGTINNVPELRVRAGATWEVADFTLTGIANFVSGSTDTGVVPSQSIHSWTTFDGNLSYRFPDVSGSWAGVDATLSLSNLFDADPPYAASPNRLYQGIYFDTTNASAIGRTIALTLRKRF